MKKINEYIDQWTSTVEDRWKIITPRKQRKYIILFFAAYMVCTIGAMLLTWQEGRKDYRKNSGVRHISNPLLNPKNQIKISGYERAE